MWPSMNTRPSTRMGRGGNMPQGEDLRNSIAAFVVALFGFVAPLHADTFPSRTITLIVPFPPGGSTDVAGRILAQHMGETLRQSVVVENVGGAGGGVAAG